MATKKLLGLLALVAVVGAGAFWYLNEMNTADHDDMMSDDHMDSDTSDMHGDMMSDHSSASGAAGASAQTQSAAQTGGSGSANVDTALSGLDATFDEPSYDDSSVDSSFSGNLDESI